MIAASYYLYMNLSGTLNDFYHNSFWGDRLFKFGFMMGVSIVIITPICLLKDVSKLRFGTLAGLTCMIAIVVMFIFQLPAYYENYKRNIYVESDQSTHINWWNFSTAYTDCLFFLNASATIVFIFNVHSVVFPIYESLALNNERRTNKFLFRSILLDTIFYILFGIVGYLTQPVKTPSIILEREKIGSSDYLISVCRLLLSAVIVVKIAINYNSLRISVFTLVLGTPQVTDKR